MDPAVAPRIDDMHSAYQFRRLISTPLWTFRSGVRALPPRTALGSIPIVGKLSPSCPPDAVGSSPSLEAQTGSPASSHTKAPNWWIVTGLGARGLVYHAWLGLKVARGVVSGDEGAMGREGEELLGWRDRAAQEEGEQVLHE